MIVKLLGIDPQRDFCDDYHLAALPVPGSGRDMNRFGAMITRLGREIDEILISLDSHFILHVGSPAIWMDKNGNSPHHFTVISEADIVADVWMPRNPAWKERLVAYAHALEASPGHLKIVVWPPHCLVGTPGHAVHAAVNDALQYWSKLHLKEVTYITKGLNIFSEHYGALKAEVPDPKDPSTHLNAGILHAVKQADIVGIGGEASSHCVMKTVLQLVEELPEKDWGKLHLIRDCMSPVAPIPSVDFPAIAEQFLADMQEKGLVITTSDRFLA